MAGEDFERAADLVELAIPAMQQGRQEATLRLTSLRREDLDSRFPGLLERILEAAEDEAPVAV